MACHSCHDPHDLKRNRAGLRLGFTELCLRCHAQEMRPPLPVDAILVHELYIRLVDQRSGLQGVFAPLVPEVHGSDAVQFLVAVKDALEDPARLLLQV